MSTLFGGLIHPPDGSKLNYVHVLFEWEEIPGSTGHDFQLSVSNDFSDPLVSANTADLYYIEKDAINWESNYYWRVRSENGDWMNPNQFSTGETSVTFQNDDKPIEILEYNPALASDGITIYGTYHKNYSAAIDMHGNEVWNSGGDTSHVFFGLDANNNFLGGQYNSQYPNSLIGCEFSINNDIIWSESVNEEIQNGEIFTQHEIIKLPNGNHMGFVPVIEKHPIPTYTNYPERITSFSWESDCYIFMSSDYKWKGEKIVEWDNEGEIVWEWNVFDHYSIDDFDYLAGEQEGHWENICSAGGFTSYDWIHFNALVYDEVENAIYVSSRHLSRITKIDYNSKQIVWNMGLQWFGDDVISFNDFISGQHGLQLLSNGNIVTLDNGIHSQIYISGLTAPISRALEINISEENGQYAATTVWSHSLSYDLYGFSSGNVQKLNSGNYLINTIGNVDGAYSIEITQNHETAWMCKYNLGTYNNGPLYRAMRKAGLYETDSPSLSIQNFNLPQSFQLKSIYPNPFNPIINIEYELSEPTAVQFGIYNINGKEIDRIKVGYKQPGFYSTIWNGKNYSSGIYFIVLGNGSKSLMKKMVLLK